MLEKKKKLHLDTIVTPGHNSEPNPPTIEAAPGHNSEPNPPQFRINYKIYKMFKFLN